MPSPPGSGVTSIDGRKTNTIIPTEDKTFSINGAKYKTIYYLLQYD